jgi:hypothetical protein
MNLTGMAQKNPLIFSADAKALTNDDEEEEEQEDERKGFSFGLNLGGYFSSSATANIYNGAGGMGSVNAASNVNWYSIEDRIGVNSLFINDVQAINTFYNSSGYAFLQDSYPYNMKYMPAFSVGLQVRYSFNRYLALIANVNAMRLKAAGQFTMQFFGTPQPLNAQADIRLFTIAADEQRFQVNLGFRQGWMMGDFSNFYFQFGGSLLGTKWQDNYIYVAERKISLITNAPVAGQSPIDAQPTAAVGFGGYGSTGVEFFIGKFSFDLGFMMSRDEMVIQENRARGWNKNLMATFTI